jgi:hypothetical protein
MAFPDLIRTPTYQQSLKTPDVIFRDPASRWAIRESHLLASYQIREAGFRLDHLIRRALDPNANPDWPPLWICSAIKTFIEVIEGKLSSTQFENVSEVHAFIGPRIDLAREIIRRCDVALIQHSRDPVSSDGFRQDVTIRGTALGISVEDLVFENPLCAIQVNDGPFSAVTQTQRELLLHMRLYWT